MPGNELFPIKLVDIYTILHRKGKQAAMQYGPTTGLPTLLESLSDYLESKAYLLEIIG